MPEKQNDRRNWYGSDRDRANQKPVKRGFLARVYTEEERRQAGEGVPGSPAILR